MVSIHAEPNVSSAFTEMQSGNYAAAAQIWDKLVQREPGFVTGLNNKGYCNLMLGNYEDAGEDYLKADAVSQNLDSKAGVQWAYLASEKYGDSIQWGKAALTIDPANFWVKRRMAYAYELQGDAPTAEKIYASLIDEHGTRPVLDLPAGQLTPYYQSMNFTGSSLKTSGFDAGAFALWNFNSGFTLGGGYARNEISNPVQGGTYATNEVRLTTAFVFSDLSSLRLTGRYLNSNSTLLDGATTLSALYRSSTFSRFSIGGDALIFSSHKGLQVTPTYTLPLSRYFFLNLGGSVQAMRFTQLTKFYGAAQASLGSCMGAFCLTAGGLYGSLYTPLFDGGAILAYGLDEMNLQGFARLSYKPVSYLEMSAAYTYGRWSSLSGETPVSNTVSFAVTGSLF